MGFKSMARVFESDVRDSSEFKTLMAIAYFVNEKEPVLKCWASTKTLAQHGRTGFNQTIKAIASLERKGYIRTEQEIGMKRYIYLNDSFFGDKEPTPHRSVTTHGSSTTPLTDQLGEYSPISEETPHRSVTRTSKEQGIEQGNTSSSKPPPSHSEEEEEASPQPKFDYVIPTAHVRAMYNEICKSLPQCRKSTPERSHMTGDRWREMPEIIGSKNKDEILRTFETFFTFVENDDFYSGRDGRAHMRFTYDRILSPKNFRTIIDLALDDNRKEKSIDQLIAEADKEQS